jgi:hypothetical protein
MQVGVKNKLNKIHCAMVKPFNNNVVSDSTKCGKFFDYLMKDLPPRKVTCCNLGIIS